MTSIEEKLAQYQDLWTSNVEKYGIVSFDNGGADILFDLSAGAPLVIDEDPEVMAIVLNRMRQAGAKVMSVEEIMKNRGR